MSRFTVQCGHAAYYANTITVQADSLEAALAKAIVAAGDDPNWKSLDHCGNIFVDAAAEGADADPWSGFGSSLPIPPEFSERGAPPRVTVMIDRGTVRDVTVEGGRVDVVITDHDGRADAEACSS